MIRGRKPSVNKLVQVTITVPESILADFDLCNRDPFRGRARYGSRSAFFVEHVKRFLAENADVLEASRKLLSQDDPAAVVALTAFNKETSAP